MFSFLRPNAGPACPSVAEFAAAVARGEMVLVDVRETAELRGSGGEIIQSSLSHEDESRLQAALSAAQNAANKS